MFLFIGLLFVFVSFIAFFFLSFSVVRVIERMDVFLYCNFMFRQTNANEFDCVFVISFPSSGNTHNSKSNGIIDIECICCMIKS